MIQCTGITKKKSCYRINFEQVDGIDQDQTARSVQSDLDLCRPQKPFFIPKPVILKGYIQR